LRIPLPLPLANAAAEPARALDGLVLEPGVPISFWRVLGRLMEARGYRLGLEGPLRINQVHRRLRARSGEVTDERVIAENRRRVQSSEELSRTRFSCGEDRCHRRQGSGTHATKDPT
jgi:hypothetical protein